MNLEDIADCILSRDMGFLEFSQKYSDFWDNDLPSPAEQSYSFLKSIIKELYWNKKSQKIVSPSMRVKYLENRNAFLEDEFVKLTLQLAETRKTEEKSVGKLLEIIPELNYSATRIQTAWRGFKARSRFPSLAATLKSIKPKSSTASEIVLNTIKSALLKFNLTLENAYRACDIDNNGTVTTEELSNFLMRFKSIEKKSMVLRYIEILDENCSGIIERDEFYECLEAYGVASEDQASQKGPYTLRLLEKFKAECENAQIDPLALFKTVSSSDTADSEEFRRALKLRFGMLNRECAALVRIFDKDNQGEIKFSEYYAVVSKNQLQIEARSAQGSTNPIDRASIGRKQPGKIDPLVSKLSGMLKLYSLDPLGVFRFANKNNFDRITTEDYISALKKLIPDYLKFISNEELNSLLPSCINQTAIRAMFTEEKAESQSEEAEYWIKRFFILIRKKKVTLQLIFIAADTDKDGVVGAFELKNACVELLDNEISRTELDLLFSSVKIDSTKKYTHKSFYTLMREYELTVI